MKSVEAPSPPAAPPPPPPPPSSLMSTHGTPPPRFSGRIHAHPPLNSNKVARSLESMLEKLQTHEQPQSAPEIDVSKLEKLVSNMAPEKAGSKEAEERRASSSIPTQVITINPLRENRTEIMLTEFELPLFPAIVSPDVGVTEIETRSSTGVEKTYLKPLHWTKVNTVLSGTLWDELQRQRPPDLDVNELEALFSNAPIKKPAGKEVDKKDTGTNPEKVQLIDSRRANNTEIMLSKTKMPLPDMVDAVLAMDDELLDIDQVENILKFCPTKEEMEQLTNYTGDLDKLGKCEHFFLELMKVPRMETKLNTFLFKVQFNTQLADLKKNLDIVHSACDEVRNSVKFKEVIKRILYLGNTLNQGTARGAAVGFKLDSLLKLNDTRAANSRMTLMHYLCKTIATKAPHLLDFPEDLVSLEAATKIRLIAVAEEMQDLTLGLRKCQKELDACANDGPISEGFRATLKRFLVHADSEVGNVSSFYSIVGKSADGLALYFGEQPTRCPFEQSTLTLFSFVRLFKKCHEEILKWVEVKGKESPEGDGNGVIECPSNP